MLQGPPLGADLGPGPGGRKLGRSPAAPDPEAAPRGRGGERTPPTLRLRAAHLVFPALRGLLRRLFFTLWSPLGCFPPPAPSASGPPSLSLSPETLCLKLETPFCGPSAGSDVSTTHTDALHWNLGVAGAGETSPRSLCFRARVFAGDHGPRKTQRVSRQKPSEHRRHESLNRSGGPLAGAGGAQQPEAARRSGED